MEPEEHADPPGPRPAQRVRIVHLTEPAFRALSSGDLAGANAASPVPLTPYFVGPQWRSVWDRRRRQVEEDPASAAWVTGVIWDERGQVAVGRAGYHGPPDEAGMVEVGYAVDPAYRRRGYARAALEALLERAAREPGVRTVRATISPGNAASYGLVAQYGFTEVGQQWDDEDGLEIIYEVDARGAPEGTSPLPFDTTKAHQARIYDYMLGGTDNYAADRAAVAAWLKVDPELASIARTNRAFLGRVVRYLAGEAGIRQFLDLGAGIPTAGNTTQVAQAIAPESRVVSVDYDPVVLAHARALLASGDAGATEYIGADLRDTAAILDQASRLLDFSEPVAVTLLAVLHAVPDSDDPYAVVARVMDAVPPGSYLAVSHPGTELIPAQTLEEMRDVARRMSRQQYTHRTREELTRFFAGTDLVEPGLVPVEEWRPEPAGTGGAGPSRVWGAVGRKR